MGKTSHIRLNRKLKKHVLRFDSLKIGLENSGKAFNSSMLNVLKYLGNFPQKFLLTFHSCFVNCFHETSFPSQRVFSCEYKRSQ